MFNSQRTSGITSLSPLGYAVFFIALLGLAWLMST